jgi:hypothetical protein
LVVAACGSAPGTPGASFPGAAELSLPPARENVAPPSADLPPDLPEFIPPPPSGAPPPPPMPIDYSTAAADLAGFVAAYREAFAVPDVEEGVVAKAGARLCTYLERNADPSGVVHLDRALADADLFEPGYPRDAWLAGFEIANRYYCTAFAVDLHGAAQ